MKNSKAFALVETLIVSTIIATILMYVFIQFNKVESKYDESFRYNGVDNLYKLDSIKEYINSLDSESIINIGSKINDDDIIIMDKNDDTYTNIEYLDNQIDLLANLDIKTLVLTKADINNVDISNLSKTLKNVIKKIDNKSDNYRIIAEFNNGECATITFGFDIEIPNSIYDNTGNRYTVVEYLESTGTQYIDTGIYPKSTTKVVFDFAFTGPNISGFKYSANGWGSSNSQEAFMWGFYDNYFMSWVSKNWTYLSTGVKFDMNRHVFTLENKMQKFDNVVYGNTGIGNTALSGETMYIFATHAEWAEQIYVPCQEKVYYTKIYDGDNLVRDYIPVIDTSNRPCLFDKVGKECYYNQGTGEFLYG